MKTINRDNGNNIKIFAKTVEETALNQIEELSKFKPYIDSKIRIMPDCHAGAGCTIGTTMEIKDKITPNLVGVDIGCGMLTVKLNKCDIDLVKLDKIINEKIPSGFTVHKEPKVEFDFSKLRRKYELDLEKPLRALGSLGGGNHFIEVGKDSKDDLYLVIHSGSRGIGNQLARLYQKTATENINKNKDVKSLVIKLKSEGRHNEISKEINKLKESTPSKIELDLAYLENDLFDDYMNDINIIQKYASLNRRVMADIILEEMNIDESSSFETTHNYIDVDRMILRKGAVSANKGEKILIPINMRDGSIIAVGKGNSDWNYSAPHGAGRLMSRKAAKGNLNLEVYLEQMEGIYTTSAVESTLDEAPGAYKPISDIIDTIVDTAEILDIIKPIYNFKAH